MNTNSEIDRIVSTWLECRVVDPPQVAGSGHWHWSAMCRNSATGGCRPGSVAALACVAPLQRTISRDRSPSGGTGSGSAPPSRPVASPSWPWWPRSCCRGRASSPNRRPPSPAPPTPWPPTAAASSAPSARPWPRRRTAPPSSSSPASTTRPSSSTRTSRSPATARPRATWSSRCRPTRRRRSCRWRPTSVATQLRAARAAGGGHPGHRVRGHAAQPAGRPGTVMPSTCSWSVVLRRWRAWSSTTRGRSSPTRHWRAASSWRAAPARPFATA